MSSTTVFTYDAHDMAMVTSRDLVSTAVDPSTTHTPRYAQPVSRKLRFPSLIVPVPTAVHETWEVSTAHCPSGAVHMEDGKLVKNKRNRKELAEARDATMPTGKPLVMDKVATGAKKWQQVVKDRVLVSGLTIDTSDATTRSCPATPVNAQEDNDVDTESTVISEKPASTKRRSLMSLIVESEENHRAAGVQHKMDSRLLDVDEAVQMLKSVRTVRPARKSTGSTPVVSPDYTPATSRATSEAGSDDEAEIVEAFSGETSPVPPTEQAKPKLLFSRRASWSASSFMKPQTLLSMDSEQVDRMYSPSGASLLRTSGSRSVSTSPVSMTATTPTKKMPTPPTTPKPTATDSTVATHRRRSLPAQRPASAAVKVSDNAEGMSIRDVVNQIQARGAAAKATAQQKPMLKRQNTFNGQTTAISTPTTQGEPPKLRRARSQQVFGSTQVARPVPSYMQSTASSKQGQRRSWKQI
eukprot:GFYU01006177.1.p1 GENE.GFYU01006177.1~~GFYU01006177.1.p1  ORF type:complete len:468 (+),score=129.15 GFYU01006177.1:169-1572(+)